MTRGKVLKKLHFLEASGGKQLWATPLCLMSRLQVFHQNQRHFRRRRPPRRAHRSTLPAGGFGDETPESPRHGGHVLGLRRPRVRRPAGGGRQGESGAALGPASLLSGRRDPALRGR